LENDISGKWLMIVDNADDSTVLFPRAASGMTQISDRTGRVTALSAYLPKSRGSILITSRSRDTAFQLIGRLDRIIKVTQFEDVDAKALLKKRLPDDPSSNGDWNDDRGALNSRDLLASVLRHQGKWMEAEELDVKIMETRKKVLGEEHPFTLISMGHLAATYRNQERWKEAEELDVKVIETRKKVLGEEHPSTLTSMGHLAATSSTA
jgi:hypothetical protein